mmetsp:Transcript_37422/g.94585  ORF Transcript_37422/g.94585 Transcript_37422/m.94585 type:complete len:168 (-) Transcript_37422:1108-1611(-)
MREIEGTQLASWYSWLGIARDVHRAAAGRQRAVRAAGAGRIWGHHKEASALRGGVACPTKPGTAVKVAENRCECGTRAPSLWVARGWTCLITLVSNVSHQAGRRSERDRAVDGTGKRCKCGKRQPCFGLPRGAVQLGTLVLPLLYQATQRSRFEELEVSVRQEPPLL